ETGLVQQLRQSVARPELNVTAIPEWIEMRVPLVGEPIGWRVGLHYETSLLLKAVRQFMNTLPLTRMRLQCTTTWPRRYALSRAGAFSSRSFQTINLSYQASSRQYVKPALPSRIPPRNKYI